ncbi:MAG: site-specific integrase, partial [Eubacterium sp.]|nr:site-specific integrase [Eubacterium sp.]
YAREKSNGRKNHVEACGAGLSDRMIRAVHTSCRSALEKAVQEGLIRANPAIGCKLPPKKSREMKVLTPNEIIRFLNRAKEEDYYELFLLELGTGMRRGEILALKWSDLNFTTGELRIERQVNAINGSLIISEPKTKSSIRTIILPPSLLQILSDYKKNVDSEWLFPSPFDNTKTRNPAGVRKRLQLILERAHCPKIRFHDLRHPYVKYTTKNNCDNLMKIFVYS